MSKLVIYTPSDPLDKEYRPQLRDFLVHALEGYGDRSEAVEKALEYALSEDDCEGGYVPVIWDENEIAAAVVMNETGMSDYIPEYVLVYIAVGEDYRGDSLGGKILGATQEFAEGNIALHVDENNPARHFFESMGFEKKYLEMRWEKGD
jgi:GNAT superfamily N-acetyltransferase